MDFRLAADFNRINYNSFIGAAVETVNQLTDLLFSCHHHPEIFSEFLCCSSVHREAEEQLLEASLAANLSAKQFGKIRGLRLLILGQDILLSLSFLNSLIHKHS
jgi:hypothetical protein